MSEQLFELLKAAMGPVVGGLGVAGIYAWFKFKGDKPKTDAESKKLSADGTITIIGGYESLINRQNEVMGKINEKIAEVQDRYTTLQDSFSSLGQQFIELQKDNKQSNQRIKVLEDEKADGLKRIDELEELIEINHQQRVTIVQEKDAEIADLKTRLDFVESELRRYKGLEEKVESVKQEVIDKVAEKTEEAKIAIINNVQENMDHISK